MAISCSMCMLRSPLSPLATTTPTSRGAATARDDHLPSSTAQRWVTSPPPTGPTILKTGILKRRPQGPRPGLHCHGRLRRQRDCLQGGLHVPPPAAAWWPRGRVHRGGAALHHEQPGPGSPQLSILSFKSAFHGRLFGIPLHHPLQGHPQAGHPRLRLAPGHLPHSSSTLWRSTSRRTPPRSSAAWTRSSASSRSSTTPSPPSWSSPSSPRVVTTTPRPPSSRVSATSPSAQRPLHRRRGADRCRCHRQVLGPRPLEPVHSPRHGHLLQEGPDCRLLLRQPCPAPQQALPPVQHLDG